MMNEEFLKEIEKVNTLSFEEKKAFYEKKLQEEVEKTKERVFLYFYYGKMFYEMEDFRKTIEIMESLLLDYQSYPYTSKMISCFTLMGMAAYCETEYRVSQYYFTVALELAQKNDAKFYYTYEYNNIALTCISQEDYENAMKYLQLAEEYLEYSNENMGAYIYINKAILLQSMNKVEEAFEVFQVAVRQYRAFEVIPNDSILCEATLCFRLGRLERYEECKKQILARLDDMYAAEYMDSCRGLFECGMASGDYELVEKILRSMDTYMENHPKESKVGALVADLKYISAVKLGNQNDILEALELKIHYQDITIHKTEEMRVKSLQESMDINAQLQKAIESKEMAAQAKAQFLANMSHDIRTPINGILGMLHIIRLDEKNPERVEDCLNKIEVSSKLLLSLVNDVLDMTKLETDAFLLNNESMNLDQVCVEATETIVFQAKEAGLQVSGEHDDFRDVYVLSSSLHLKKILINLFSNSIKYNKPGGSIHTSMRVAEKTEDEIVCMFKIEDTGIGMSEDFIQNKLFKPFMQEGNSSRSNYNGTGLGMAIVKQLVEKMGGSISVESELGKGSCFTVILPFKLDKQIIVKTEEEKTEADISGMRFLVAEDNELNLEIVEFLLSEQGAEVVSAQNGLEAVEKFKESDEGTYDAILMDLMMPVMDGFTATEKIRALDRPDAKTIPIIAMTANAFKEDEEKCLGAGMNAHLAKPLEFDKLKRTIAALVR